MPLSMGKVKCAFLSSPTALTRHLRAGFFIPVTANDHPTNQHHLPPQTRSSISGIPKLTSCPFSVNKTISPRPFPSILGFVYFFGHFRVYSAISASAREIPAPLGPGRSSRSSSSCCREKHLGMEGRHERPLPAGCQAGREGGTMGSHAHYWTVAGEDSWRHAKWERSEVTDNFRALDLDL